MQKDAEIHRRQKDRFFLRKRCHGQCHRVVDRVQGGKNMDNLLCRDVFRCGDVYVRFTASVCIRETKDGTLHVVHPTFDAWMADETGFSRRAQWNDLAITQTVCPQKETTEEVKVSLSVSNNGSHPLYIETLTPVRVVQGELRLGDAEAVSG